METVNAGQVQNQWKTIKTIKRICCISRNGIILPVSQAPCSMHSSFCATQAPFKSAALKTLLTCSWLKVTPSVFNTASNSLHSMKPRKTCAGHTILIDCSVSSSFFVRCPGQALSQLKASPTRFKCLTCWCRSP